MFSSSCSAQDAPDIVLHNGKIVTVDDEFRIVTAMAIRGDRILAVGSNKDLLNSANAQTEIIDLHGKTVLPGLMDSHTHASGAAVYEFDHEVPVMNNIADVLAYIRGRAELLEDGETIFTSQVFITRLEEQRFPTRAELDSAAPSNPVYFRTGPDMSLNSMALKLNGIDKNSKEPADQSGKVERDKQGEPTGILRFASQLVKVKSSGNSPSSVERKERLKRLLADYNRVGITSHSERNVSSSTLKLYKELLAENELTCRSFLCWGVNPNDTPDKIKQRLDEAANDPAHEYNNMLWLRGVKVFLDGGMLTGSAYMREPWGLSKVYSITDPDYRGVRNINDLKLYEVVRMCLERDLQFTAHSVGDGAVHALLDTYRRINDNDFPIREHRPCITHCNFMSAEAIQEMKAMGIVADLQPAWLWMDGHTLQKHFGDDRLKYFQPYNSIFDAGVIVGGGSDHMQRIGDMRSVNPYNPFLGMWITLTRSPRDSNGILHSEQRITREQALQLYTINNAFLMFDEKNRGSLEADKLADFIVIDRDYLSCPVDDVKEIEVESTWLGGKKVYSTN
ncbi:amidohydrolase [bacterium]|nr:amidohydrolase [bacterium]